MSQVLPAWDSDLVACPAPFSEARACILSLGAFKKKWLFKGFYFLSLDRNIAKLEILQSSNNNLWFFDDVGTDFSTPGRPQAQDCRKGQISFSSSFLSSQLGLCNNILTREEHVDVFSIRFMRHGSLQKEMKTQRNGRTWVFWVRHDEEWKVVDRYDGMKGMK